MWGRLKLLLYLPMSWTSDNESALAFHGLIPAERPIALFILNVMASRQRPHLRFSLNRSIIPVLIQAIPSCFFVTHPSVLQSQADERKKHHAKVNQYQLSPGSPSSAQPLPLSRLPLPHAISSPSSHLPPSSYSQSHVPHTLPRRPPPWFCITECDQDDQSSVFLVSLYKEDSDVYLPGLDLKTDIANGFKELRSCASGMLLPIDDLSRNA